MPVGEHVEIPPEVIVRCPLVKFKLRPAFKCDGCDHFKGLAEQLRSPRLEFHQQYAVRCAYPIDRELLALAEDD